MGSSRRCGIWWAGPSDARVEHLRHFTDAERERAAAYRRPVDSDRFTVGCALTRLVLADLLRVEPAAVPLTRDCPDCGAPHGRPQLGLADDATSTSHIGNVVRGKGGVGTKGDRWHLSVSHSGDHVVVAVSDAGPVGIDVERIDPDASAAADLVLAPAERDLLAGLPPAKRTDAFFRYWVRKEAILKATGAGMRIPMSAVRVSGPDEAPEVLSVPRGVHPAGVGPNVPIRLYDLPVDSRHLAALAVIADAEPEIARRDGKSVLAATR